MPTSYRVYVLQNGERTFYIGITDNVSRRTDQHNRGVSKWTRGKGPWNLVWQSKPMMLAQSRKLELLLKRQKRGDGFYRLTGLPRPPS